MFIAGAAAFLSGGPALAQQDRATRSVVRQLERQGFEVTAVRRTLLGRIRVLSRRGDLFREIVFDPRNGAILRDYTVDRGGDPSVGPSPDDVEQGRPGEDDDAYDDDDDDTDDNDTDDNDTDDHDTDDDGTGDDDDDDADDDDDDDADDDDD
jgi:hypothetical protein